MPTSVAGSAKRRRTDEEEGEEGSGMTEAVNLTPPTRSEIWFDDGSIVLQAENVQFMVHRTMLSRHSEIFKDMFAMPQPPGEPTVEGCPVVHLLDSPEDVKNLLIALYDKNYNTREPIPFEVAAAMIRMGRKYELEQLRNEALVRLTSEFPIKMEAWESLPPVYTHLVERDGLLFDIVNLALENDIRSILPSAYYLCVQDLEDLLEGLKRKDGTIVRLPADIQRICIIGRENILRSQAESTFAWVEGLGEEEDCDNPAQCTRIGTSLMKDLWMPLPEVSRTLEKWTDFISLFPCVKELCQFCLEDAQMCHDAGRKRVWEALPRFFGLGEWNELENFRN